jgi:hypothetical protein
MLLPATRLVVILLVTAGGGLQPGCVMKILEAE